MTTPADSRDIWGRNHQWREKRSLLTGWQLSRDVQGRISAPKVSNLSQLEVTLYKEDSRTSKVGMRIPAVTPAKSRIIRILLNTVRLRSRTVDVPHSISPVLQMWDKIQATGMNAEKYTPSFLPTIQHQWWYVHDWVPSGPPKRFYSRSKTVNYCLTWQCDASEPFSAKRFNFLKESEQAIINVYLVIFRKKVCSLKNRRSLAVPGCVLVPLPSKIVLEMVMVRCLMNTRQRAYEGSRTLKSFNGKRHKNEKKSTNVL